MLVVEVVVCMVFIFLVFSILVSGLQEWVAQFTGRRGAYLVEGVRRLIGDEMVTSRVLLHPLISGLFRASASQGKPPSYVEPRNFVLALCNVLVRRRAEEVDGTVDSRKAASPRQEEKVAQQELTLESLRRALQHHAVQRSALANALLPMIDSADNLEAALKSMESWFNSGMERVSGWYKSRTQKVLFVIAFLVAILFNVDSIAIATYLARSADARAAIASMAEQVVREKRVGGVEVGAGTTRPLDPAEANAIVSQLTAGVAQATSAKDFPIGRSCLSISESGSDDGFFQVACTCFDAAIAPGAWSLLQILGWVLTALAAVLGAPYWFAALSKIIDIRGSGTKPATPSSS